MKRIALAALVALLATGCSVLHMEREPSGYRPEVTPTCTGNRMMPALDATVAATVVAVTAAVLNDHASNPDTEIAPSSVAFVGGITVALVASSVYGFHQRRRCLRARAAHDRWLVEQPARLPVIDVPPGQSSIGGPTR